MKNNLNHHGMAHHVAFLHISIAKLYQLLRLPVLQGLAVLGLTLSQAYK